MQRARNAHEGLSTRRRVACAAILLGSLLLGILGGWRFAAGLMLGIIAEALYVRVLGLRRPQGGAL